MKRITFLLPLLMIASPVIADDLAITDFAYGYTLDIDANGPIYSVDIPDKVYQVITQSNYADVRVFNASNISIPNLLKHEKPSIEENIADVTIPLFPMTDNKKSQTSVNGAPSIRIQTNAQGAIVNIDPLKNTSNGKKTKNKTGAG
jgi:hypothetical protein